jgi:effector-binding domain-containing protein
MAWFKAKKTGRLFQYNGLGFYSHSINEVVIEYSYPVKRNKQGDILYSVANVPLHRHKHIKKTGQMIPVDADERCIFPNEQFSLFK